MIWIRLFALLGFVGFFHLLFNGIVFLLSASIVYSSLPLQAAKTTILIFKMTAVFVTCQLLLSFQVNPVLTVVPWVLFTGGELETHLKKRTTAAYSTSDSQNQRFFNITLLAMILSALAAAALHLLGKNITPSFLTNYLLAASANVIFQIFACSGLLILFLRFKIVGKHSRTLLYVLRSHLRSLFQGKMKRKW